MSSTTSAVDLRSYLQHNLLAVAFVDEACKARNPAEKLTSILSAIQERPNWTSDSRLKTLHKVTKLTLKQNPAQKSTPCTEQCSPSLLGIPGEIQERIAHMVSYNDMLHLQATCRKAHAQMPYWLAHDSEKVGRYLSKLLEKKQKEAINQFLKAGGSDPVPTRCDITISVVWARLPIVLNKIHKKFPNLGLKLTYEDTKVEAIGTSDLFRHFFGAVQFPAQAVEKRTNMLYLNTIIASCPKVRRLDITGSLLDPTTIDCITRLRQLKKLVLDNTIIDKASYSTIVRSCSQLRQLSVHSCSNLPILDVIECSYPDELEDLQIGCKCTFRDSTIHAKFQELLGKTTERTGIFHAFYARFENIGIDLRKQHAEKAVRLMPRFVPALMALARVLLTEGADTRRAKQLIETASSINPENVVVLLLLAQLLRLGSIEVEKDFLRAKALYEKILTCLPNEPEILIGLSWILMEGDSKVQKDFIRAHQLLQRAFKLDSLITAYPLAYLLTYGPDSLKDLKKAEELLKKAQGRFPQDQKIEQLLKELRERTWVGKAVALGKKALQFFKLG